MPQTLDNLLQTKSIKTSRQSQTDASLALPAGCLSMYTVSVKTPHFQTLHSLTFT